ncbi:hypothetical protein [Dielma fastidiosa]|uniref:hypothetical protein n=1 Tax=Dielma fastidiosa TaxID=1034346 RepID=UPI0015F9A59E|nr:hypothetical protein [Dielma fastidiosa]
MNDILLSKNSNRKRRFDKDNEKFWGILCFSMLFLLFGVLIAIILIFAFCFN